jgi:hypothetical protein
MANYVDIAYLKEHSYIPDGVEDDYLEKILSAAEDHVQKVLQCDISDYRNDKGEIPSDLKQAIVIYAATLHENRESVAFGAPQAVPYNYMDLITPYIKFT